MTSKANHYDVVIVGAGPAGSSCATILAEHGVRVLLLDKEKFPREKICGDCINPKCWPLLELLGPGEQLRQINPRMISEIRITNATGIFIHHSLKTNSLHPFFSIKRSDFDATLLKRARDAGGEVLEETTVKRVHWTNRWEVSLQQRAGEQNVVTCDYLVGADGRNSLVARKMSDFASRRPPRFVFATPAKNLRGLSSERSRTSLKDNRVGVQWHTAHQPNIGSAVEMFLFDSGYGGVVNTNGNRANIALVTRPEVAQLAKKDFSLFLQKTFCRNPRVRNGFESLEPIDEIRTTSPINPAIYYSNHPNAFLIGDAHRTVEPFTGEGVFFALQDGIQVAYQIISRFDPELCLPRHPIRSRFWVNQVYSRALRHTQLASKLIAFGAHMPFFLPYTFRPIFS